MTLAITMNTSRKLLPPMLMFKGATIGGIANHEFKTYPDHGDDGCKDIAWTDEEMIYKWIDFVIILWNNATPPRFVIIHPKLAMLIQGHRF